ncbi:hypothetical protein CR152_23065 [Massilia violaceinigra]|uniref:Uncharacterized protein n=1 Tax=Massilia violaceinigra TaxID=2045208 RepID=A0A2D2DQ21_9BURK|nr:hypothetical protein [Massilia violaceinigra]ATQ77072.1 hypothetical protein CR152_23065 [Massilia violaceinigra]
MHDDRIVGGAPQTSELFQIAAAMSTKVHAHADTVSMPRASADAPAQAVFDSGMPLTDRRPSTASQALIQASMHQSPRTRQLRAMQAVADGAHQRRRQIAPVSHATPSAGGVAQLVKAEIRDEMPQEVKDALEFLNYVEAEFASITENTASAVEAQIAVLEKHAQSEFADVWKALIESIKTKLPAKVEAVDLDSKRIHSIWVEGEYATNEEFRHGIATRKGTKAAGWQNLIWVYKNARENDAGFEVVDRLKFRAVSIDDFGLKEVDFSATMALWEDRPDWVGKFMPILNILLAKKSYVAMSDIMRMIILFYSGGLYQDVKIELASPQAQFFDTPKVNTDKLQLVDDGPNTENWAMVAQAGCSMIDKIMKATLAQFPKPEKLEQMPENYSIDGKIGKSHVDLHENMGPWNQIGKHLGQADRIERVNDSLKLDNPRPLNSWLHAVNDNFAWD